MLIKKVVPYIRRRVFPTPQELMVQKWYADGGDYALRFNYDLNKESVVLDLGGYEGQWASDLFARYQCPTYVFEPVISFANSISERFSHNDKIQIYPYGLGGASRSEEIHLLADGSSIFRKSGSTEKIEIIDVKDWIDRNLSSDQDIDLMKVNIEGGEYELLDRLIETQLINRIKNLQVQFHQISQDSTARMEKIQAGLMNTHEPTYQYKFVWEDWKRKSNG